MVPNRLSFMPMVANASAFTSRERCSDSVRKDASGSLSTSVVKDFWTVYQVL
jgi:hypothetical protein